MAIQRLAPRDSVCEFRDEMDRLLTGFLVISRKVGQAAKGGCR